MPRLRLLAFFALVFDYFLRRPADEIGVRELGVDAGDVGCSARHFPFQPRFLGGEIDDAGKRQRRHLATHQKLYGASRVGVPPQVNVMGTLMAVAHKEPVPPRELEPTIPAALSDLILQLMAKEPKKRPPSARAVADALATRGLRVVLTGTAIAGRHVPKVHARRARKG